MGHPLLENFPQVCLMERNQEIQTFTAGRRHAAVSRRCPVTTADPQKQQLRAGKSDTSDTAAYSKVSG
jgi:hypothetical protein